MSYYSLRNAPPLRNLFELHNDPLFNVLQKVQIHVVQNYLIFGFTLSYLRLRFGPEIDHLQGYCMQLDMISDMLMRCLTKFKKCTQLGAKLGF